jgi:hypothetical protein
LDTPVDEVSPEAVVSPPTVDIPASVKLGNTWTRVNSWLTLYYEMILVSNNFTACATVDASGTIVLPQIGALPALRVHEIHSYSISEVTSPPLLLDSHTNDYYYWLVPGLGVAVQVLLLGNNILCPMDLPYTNAVQRMFVANYFTNSTGSIPPSPANLRIAIQAESVVLNWDSLSNSTSYRVDCTTALPATNWQPLGYTTGNTWTNTMSYGQGFYRVAGLP